MRKARIASLTLRSSDSSSVSRKLRATCCVMVDAPIGRRFGVGEPRDVLDDGADRCEHVDAGMAVEVLVLGGEEGLHHALRDHLERHEDTLLGGVLGHQAAVAGMDAGHHRRLVVGELGVFGQAAAEMPKHVEGAASGDDHAEEHQGGEGGKKTHGLIGTQGTF
jgi:hypothetical protein